MKFLFFLSLFLFSMNTTIVFDFNTDSDLINWRIVDDGVMGGLSDGSFSIDENGHGVFKGNISLQNNGGFSSLRHYFSYMDVSEKDSVVLRVKGDGKPYEFRVKHDRQAYYSYVYTFTTSGDWEEIVIPLSEMSPAYRGRSLNIPDFNHDTIGELTFLFGNKKPESFQLLIDKISIR
jgi:hypothetical protein